MLKNFNKISPLLDSPLFFILFFAFKKYSKLNLSGEKIAFPNKYWFTLFDVLELVKINVKPSWFNDEIYLSINGYKFVTSAIDSSIAVTLKESFVDDEYKLSNLDLKGKVVLDVGANIGDSSVNFASRGAKKVYAFEPLPMIHSYLEKNVELNNMEDIIDVHKVGLSNINTDVEIFAKSYASACTSSIYHSVENIGIKPGWVKQKLKLVNAIEYFKLMKIPGVDVLKMDCEGCEYDLLTNDDFINYVDADYILFEFHDGLEKISTVLINNGYIVTTDHSDLKVGVAYAKR